MFRTILDTHQQATRVEINRDLEMKTELRLGRVLMREGNNEEAALHFLRAFQYFPTRYPMTHTDSVWALLRIVQVWTQLGYNQEPAYIAETLLQDDYYAQLARAQRPRFVHLVNVICHRLGAKGESEQALRIMEKLQTVIASDTSSKTFTPMFLTYADLLEKEGQRKRAADIYCVAWDRAMAEDNSAYQKLGRDNFLRLVK